MRPHSPPAARGAGWRPAAAPPGCGRSGRPRRARRAASSGACRWSPHDGCTATAGCSGTSPPAAGARAAETRAPRPPGGRAPPAAHPRARRPQGSLAGASRRAPDSQPRAGTSAGAPPTQRHRRFRRTAHPGPAHRGPRFRHAAASPLRLRAGVGGARGAARVWGVTPLGAFPVARNPRVGPAAAGRWRCALGLGPGACPGSTFEGMQRGGGVAGGGTTSEVAARTSLSGSPRPETAFPSGVGRRRPGAYLARPGRP